MNPSDAPTPEAHQQAFTEVSFLLDIFATTVDELMGGATASVGRVAGRHMAHKLPIALEAQDLAAAAAALAAYGQLGVRPRAEPGTDLMSFDGCAVRQVCRARGREPGGDLCRLFHFYLDGVLDGLTGRPVRSTIVTAGEACQIRVATR